MITEEIYRLHQRGEEGQGHKIIENIVNLGIRVHGLDRRIKVNLD